MLLITSSLLILQSRKVRFDMAGTTTKSSDKIQRLDQMLEDLAGEELGEFDEDFELSSDLDIFSDTDEFAEIDSYH